MNDRYRIERELGRGGNATVYLAQDLKHDRKVAVKVLLPGLAESVRAERFLREIQIAAKLTHPHILPLHDSGSAEGFLYYVMPYMEGESLRDRLQREPQLPLADALQIGREVADALSYAHEHDVVHRDIKPENILLQAGHAVVADFGIARALTEASGQAVTQTGIAVGTPVYMSPEQSAGSKTLDGRSDVYSLGCVVYEMLVGQPPFVGDSAQEILAHHALDPVPPLRRWRADVPAGVADALLIALAKRPVERFPTAAEFAAALAPPGERARLHVPTPRAAAQGLGPALTTAVILAVASGLVGGWGLWRARTHSVASPTLVAVLPFTVRGSADVAYLGEGMVNLLSTSLDGAGNLRAADPHAVLSVVQHGAGGTLDPAGAADVAERLGAGSYVLGDVVEAGGRVQLTASLYDREHGSSPLARGTVDGSGGQVFSLVDGLATQLLSQTTTGPTGRVTRVASVTTPSLLAYKAYLDGDAAFRAGRADSAVAALEHAVALDTAFALAYYRLSVAAEWATRAPLAERSAERAVRHSARLTDHDRLLLRALLATRRGAALEAEGLYRSILGTYPDDIEAWIELGEVLFHYGPTLGRPVTDSRVPFERVLYFDPGYVSAMVHLARIAAVEGRRGAVDSLVSSIVKLSPTSDRELEMRVLRAYALGDVPAQQRVLPDLGRVSDGILPLAVWNVAVYVGDLDGAAVFAGALADPARSRDAQAVGHTTLAYLALAGGRLEGARAELRRTAASDSVRALEFGTLLELAPFVEPRRGTLEGARRALQRLDPGAVAASTLPSVSFNVHDGVHAVLRAYLLGVLGARLGDFAAAEKYAAALAATQGPRNAGELPRDLALEVRAEVATVRGKPGPARALLKQRRGESWYQYHFASPFLSGSRARYLQAGLEAAAAQGDDAVRRAVTLFSAFEGYSAFDLIYAGPARLRRAALYERLGDRQAAAADYARFLKLWTNCDPEFRPLLDSARAGYERATTPR